MSDLYDIVPQKFYLLSPKKRSLIDFSSADHAFAKKVDNLFDNIKKEIGGNIHAVYRFEPNMLDAIYQFSEENKKEYPFVQQLPKYFKGFDEGDYFIRQKSDVPLIDLKRAILETESRSRELDIKKQDDWFVMHWGKLYLSFDTYSYGFLTDKVYVGKKDRDKRICRFCKGTGSNRYKNISYALQEGLGNHLLFANEECDECNNLFSNMVERPLFTFLETNRNLSQVKGKGKHLFHQEGLNFHIHPDAIEQIPIVYVMQEHIINACFHNQPTGKIILYNKPAITFQGIYKALIKFAIDMIPAERICHFNEVGEWVHGDYNFKSLPPFLYGEHNSFFEQPILDLFFRKENNTNNIPYCTAVVYIFSSVFILVVPSIDKDNIEHLASKDIASHYDKFKRLCYLHVQEWAEYNSNDVLERAADYKVSVIGVEGKYKVEYRPSTDEVFKILRNN